MTKKFWVVLDSDLDARMKRGNTGCGQKRFDTLSEAAEFARELVREHECDYYIAEVVAIATAPKAPVEVIDLVA